MKFMSDPTDFSGDIRRTNPINWLKKLDRIKTLGQLNDESILLIAVDHLTEQAGCWYNLTYTGNEDTTWVEFKAAFKAKYCIDVEIRMRELFQLVEVKDERMIKRTFLKAIHSEIALEVERSGIDDKTTLQDLVLKAMKAEKFLRKYKMLTRHKIHLPLHLLFLEETIIPIRMTNMAIKLQLLVLVVIL
ncbi:hypothetical protein EDC96DRAFT_550632 [Choanephora cucurbitarum]|nr:hypothetical protein EDC96DRAFT_550632 [Choanephora cucurbitarum]